MDKPFNNELWSPVVLTSKQDCATWCARLKKAEGTQILATLLVRQLFETIIKRTRLLTSKQDCAMWCARLEAHALTACITLVHRM